MILPMRCFAAAVLAAGALVTPAAAHAAPPWSAPGAVPGTTGQATSDPHVLFTRTRGGAIAVDGAGQDAADRDVLRSILGDGLAPLPATPWTNAHGFDLTFGQVAAGDRIAYIGTRNQRVQIAIAPGPESGWRTELRGPTTGGARVAAAAAPHGGAALAFSTFGKGSMGSVYVVRQSGVKAPGPTERLSGRGHIRSVAVSVNARGDVLAGWDRSGTIEIRTWHADTRRWTAVRTLGTVKMALHLTVALGADRRASVAWVDQGVGEGDSGPGRLMVSARSDTRGFLPAEQLDSYALHTLPGGEALEAGYTADGRGLLAWSGASAIRVARIHGRVIGAPQDLAPVAPDPSWVEIGLGDLAISPAGQAVVAWTARIDATRTQIFAAPLAAGAAAFGPAEAVSAPTPDAAEPSAGFDPESNRIVLAWHVQGPTEVDVAQRATPYMLTARSLRRARRSAE